MAEIGTLRIQDIPHGVKEIEWIIEDYFTITWKSLYCKSPSFSFAEVYARWHLTYGPGRGNYKEKLVALDLHRNVQLEYAVEYSFGLRKGDGSVMHVFRGTMECGALRTDFSGFDFIKKEELLHRESELVPDNTLTIICTLKRKNEANHSTHEERLLKLKSLHKLSDNFKDLFADKETCDVTLRVQDMEYQAHRTVLMARSKVLAANFKHDTLERQTGVITISDCDPDSFMKFLEYLYSGEVEQLCFRSAITLYYTSDKYDVEELKEFCIHYLMHHLTVENVCDIVAFAHTRDEKKLFSKAQDFFNKNVTEICATSEWESFTKNDFYLANRILFNKIND